MTDSNNIVIVNAAGTLFGMYGGLLKDFGCYDLGAVPIRSASLR